MTRARYYKSMFVAGAVWNWAAGFAVFAFEQQIRGWLKLPPSNDPVTAKLFGACVITFGIGYFIVSRDLAANRGIVLIGIIGKVLLFGLTIVYAFTGECPYAYVAATSVDLFFACLFGEFLLNTESPAPGNS